MPSPGVKLSLWRVLTRDFISLNLVMPAGIFVVLVYFYDIIPMDILFIILVLDAVAFSWRYSYFKKFYKNGQETPARITYHSYKSFFNWWDEDSIKKYMCRIRYSYTFQDRTYEGKALIRGGNSIFSDSGKLRKGDEILILVDPDEPQRSIIRNMYMPGAQTLLEPDQERKPSGLHSVKRKKIKADG